MNRRRVDDRVAITDAVRTRVISAFKGGVRRSGIVRMYGLAYSAVEKILNDEGILPTRKKRVSK